MSSEEEPIFDQIYEHKEYKFAYYSLNYAEFNLVSRAMYHPINIRQIFEQHVKIFKGDELIDPIYDDFYNKPLVVRAVVEHIYNNTSEFKNKDSDTFPELVRYNYNHLLKIDGVYDIFIYKYLGMDAVIEAHNRGPQYRALLISILQRIYAIDIEERFKDSVENQTPLNLNPEDLVDAGSSINEQKMLDELAQKGGDPIEIMAAQKALKRKLREDKKNPKKTYSWQNDTDYNKIATETQRAATLRPGGTGIS